MSAALVQFFSFFRRKLPLHFRRASHRQTAVRNLLIFQNQTSGSDQTLFSDPGPVQYNRTHTDQTSLADGTAMENGIVLVPEDRKLQGIISNLSVAGNINISLMKQNSNKLGIISAKKEAKEADDGIRNFRIKTPSPDKKIVELSGGNQQKCIVARGVATHPKVLILDEPTKGIDVGAKYEIYKIMCDLAQQGAGVIMISSELPEIIRVSNRVVVMCEGRITGEVKGDEIDQTTIMRYATMREAQAIGGE